MKKILIVSYDYSPLPHAASYMVQSRAKHLAALGWEPVILTRQWREDSSDLMEESNEPVKRERDPIVGCLVYRTPYKQYLKGMVRLRSRYASDTVIFKVINFILRSFFFYPCVFKGWHKIAVSAGIEIVKNENIAGILSVGSPWTDHLVSRDISRATGIKWIASYMDPWTQEPDPRKWKRKFSWKWGIARLIGRHVEKSICSSAYCAVHNSEPWAKELKKFLGINVYPITHGIDHADVKGFAQIPQDSRVFTLSYVGSVHFTQKTDIFFKGFSKFIEENDIPENKLKMRFVGSGSMDKRYEKYANIKKYVENISQVPREEAVKCMFQSHVLLLFLIDDDGWYPMKSFEYLTANSQILATPRDHGVIENILKESGKGVCLDTPGEVACWLKEKWGEFCANGCLSFSINRKVFEKIDRKKNVENLTRILDEMTGLGK